MILNIYKIIVAKSSVVLTIIWQYSKHFANPNSIFTITLIGRGLFLSLLHTDEKIKAETEIN